MALYREQGVVLRSYKLGETDRIVHVLTPGRGKVRAVAKGVRRPGSRFGGRLESFSHVDLQLYEGRNLDVISQAELITPFAGVRADFALSACASVLAEAADRVAQEHERNVGLFLLLLDGLRALSRDPVHPSLVVDAYLLRLASIAGYHPYLEACASCGEPGRHAGIAIGAGGLLCDGCAPREAQPMAPAVLDLLSAFVAAEWDALPAVPADARSRRSAGALVSSFVAYHLGRPLRSMDLVPR